MRILLTNDDGIEAPGLNVLEEIARALTDDIWIVAPETDQSGAAHSLSLHEPMRCRSLGHQKFAVKGTPTDCVIMGVRHLMADNPPDLVLSGVNAGQNIADDVTYSGTIAGAMEGTMLGIPSIALSQAYPFTHGSKIKWQTPLDLGPDVIRKCLDAGWPEGVLLNVNFPDQDTKDISETLITVQGKRDQGLVNIEERHDTRGTPYYWFALERRKSNPSAGTDLKAIYDGHVSITPIGLNLTHNPTVEMLSKRYNQ